MAKTSILMQPIALSGRSKRRAWSKPELADPLRAVTEAVNVRATPTQSIDTVAVASTAPSGIESTTGTSAVISAAVCMITGTDDTVTGVVASVSTPKL